MEQSMAGDDAVVYRLRTTFCGKPGCRACREGKGHGPYWYAYRTIDGRTKKSYIGKSLPPELEQEARRTDSTLIRLYTLGRVHLERRTRAVEGEWYAVKETSWSEPAQVLLAGLASSPERRLSVQQARDVLAAAGTAAAVEVTQAVQHLRHLLEPPMRVNQQRVLETRLVEATPTFISLTDQSRLWIDADAFESLLERAQAASDPTERASLLEQALSLYQGEFWPQERQAAWARERREALRRKWLGLLLDTADMRVRDGDVQGGIEALGSLLAADPLHEPALLRLMLLLAQSAQRGEALRLYQRFASRVEQEYAASPPEELRRVYEAIRSGTTLDMSYPQETGLPSIAPPRQATLPSSEQPVSGMLSIGRTHQRPLVGREKERAALHALLLQVERERQPGREERAQPALGGVLVRGEAGIGKTRLAEETAREANGRGWMVIWTRAHMQESMIPYQPWTEALRQALLQETWLRQEIAGKPAVYYALRTLLPELHDLLPLTSPDDPFALPEHEQLRLWEAVRALFTVICQRRPLCLVLDDLQWADERSIALFGYLARHLHGLPVLLVGTLREGELQATHPLLALLADLTRQHLVFDLILQPLTDEQISQLVAEVPAPLVPSIRSRAAGNPFFAEELARGWQTHLLSLDQPLKLPDTIAAILELRLSRLSLDCLRLLSRAAVLGETFDFSTLLAMERGEIEEDAMLDLVEEALATGILVEEGNGAQISYAFWHPLLASHLYDRLSAGRRASLHRRAADALQQRAQGREEESAAAITEHLLRADAEAGQIARYAELAGNRAYTLSAYPDAERYYRLVVAYRRGKSAAADPLHLARLLERLGECAMIQAKYEEARSWYEQIIEISSAADVLGATEEIQREAAQRRALLWTEVGWTWRHTGDLAEARRCYERGVQELRKAGLTAGPAWAGLYYLQSHLCWQESRYEEARQSAERALALFEEVLAHREMYRTFSTSALADTRIERTLAGDPVDVGRLHTLLAEIAAIVGQSDEATAHYTAALAIFEQQDQAREIANVCCNLGDLYLRRAEHRQAESSLRRALSIAERIGDRATCSVIYGNLGVLAQRYGTLAEAEALYKQALALAEQINDPVYSSLEYNYLASALHEQGKQKEATAALRRALTWSRTIPFCQGFALMTLAHMRLTHALSEGDEEPRAQPSGHYEQALTQARSTAQRVLAMEGLEAETRTEGHLLLARIARLFRDLPTAQAQAQKALEQAQQYDQRALHAQAMHLLGAIAAEQGEQEQATAWFEQALAFYRTSGMRLEEARTLLSYGATLFQWHTPDSDAAQRGYAFLQEARQAFEACRATLDERRVDRLLAQCAPQATSDPQALPQ